MSRELKDNRVGNLLQLILTEILSPFMVLVRCLTKFTHAC